jgi:hypothetical protein
VKREDKKAAIAAYKERKPVAGIYAVRCAATGQCWTGGAPDLATVWTRLTFTLRQGGGSNRALAQAWGAHGPDGLTFEVMERFEDEQLAHERARLLRDRLDHWRRALGAEPV